MLSKTILSALLVLTSIFANSQDNFSYTPARPKPGDLVTFEYQPAGDIANSTAPVQAVAFVNRNGKPVNALDIPLKKENKKYKGTVQTDTAGNFIYFNFSSNSKARGIKTLSSIRA